MKFLISRRPNNGAPDLPYPFVTTIETKTAITKMTPITKHRTIFISFSHISFRTLFVPRRKCFADTERSSVVSCKESNLSPRCATFLMFCYITMTVSSIWSCKSCKSCLPLFYQWINKSKQPLQEQWIYKLLAWGLICIIEGWDRVTTKCTTDGRIWEGKAKCRVCPIEYKRMSFPSTSPCAYVTPERKPTPILAAVYIVFRNRVSVVNLDTETSSFLSHAIEQHR